MNDLIREAVAPFIGLAVYLTFSRVERRGYERGYEDALNDRPPKHRPRVAFKTKEPEK